jgi:hypothetical protein
MRDPAMSQTQFIESIEVQLTVVQMIPASALQALDAIAIALAVYKLSQGFSSSDELAS